MPERIQQNFSHSSRIFNYLKLIWSVCIVYIIQKKNNLSTKFRPSILPNPPTGKRFSMQVKTKIQSVLDEQKDHQSLLSKSAYNDSLKLKEDLSVVVQKYKVPLSAKSSDLLWKILGATTISRKKQLDHLEDELCNNSDFYKILFECQSIISTKEKFTPSLWTVFRQSPNGFISELSEIVEKYEKKGTTVQGALDVIQYQLGKRFGKCSIEDGIDRLQEDIGKFDALNDLNKKNTELRGQVTNLATQVTTLQTENTGLRGEVTILAGQVTTLTTQVTGLQTQIDTGLKAMEERMMKKMMEERMARIDEDGKATVPKPAQSGFFSKYF